MRTIPSLKGIARGVVVVGLVGAGQFAIPVTANAATPTPSAVRAYGAPPSVNVVVNPGGDSITINVGGNASGTVTVRLGGKSYTLTLANGQATFAFPANLPLGSYAFSVTYNGPGGSTSVTTNTLFVTKYGTVVGVEAYRALLRANGVGANRGGVSGSDSDDSGTDSSDDGTLPATGAGAPTELLGLLGLGLLVAGGSSIVIARRRARI